MFERRLLAAPAAIEAAQPQQNSQLLTINPVATCEGANIGHSLRSDQLVKLGSIPGRQRRASSSWAPARYRGCVHRHKQGGSSAMIQPGDRTHGLALDDI